MFNVIICDDNKNDLKKVYNIIKNYMITNNIEYDKHVFNDYDDNFMRIINKKFSFKIYILDIETPSRSGIDVAREIRRRDMDSAIVFLTGHNDLGMELLQEDIPFSAFINKFVKCEIRLKNCLRNVIKQMYKHRVLKIHDGTSLYNVNLDTIKYITRDSVERKTIIITDDVEFRLNKSLNSILGLLNDNFVQTHRACIINMNRTVKIDHANRQIIFDDGDVIDLISSKYRKEVMK